MLRNLTEYRLQSGSKSLISHPRAAKNRKLVRSYGVCGLDTEKSKISWSGGLSLQPGWQLTCGWQMDDTGASNRLQLADILQCRRRRFGIEIKHTNRVAPLLVAFSAYGHLANIDAVLATNCAHIPNDSRNVLMEKNQQATVEIGF